MLTYNLENSDNDSIYPTDKFTADFQSFIQATGYNYSEVREIFNELTYIGPLREKPHRYYETAGETMKSVGPRGENMPNLLKRYHNKIKDQLNEWIREFEFGDELLINNISDSLFSINFTEYQTGISTNLANAGFGASQILPLIVQALTSNEGSMTIAEQPEIHLNPRLQCVLADLFVFMANKNQRIIVETHSEHLLLRLRRLIAEKKLDYNKVAIYFIEKINGESKIRNIELNQNGHIPPLSWPEGFFGEGLKESLALATIQAKK